MAERLEPPRRVNESVPPGSAVGYGYVRADGIHVIPVGALGP